ncbi:unnamed protein product [Rotaria sordida]|uniref:Uncharacterized protein n=1 Tax=Rotaria sordida TaxID=392033 RepID=A0A819V679_9BILA|nr:unnamed protein product [Rotaria sordida]
MNSNNETIKFFKTSKLARDVESDGEKEDVEKEDAGDVLYLISIDVEMKEAADNPQLWKQTRAIERFLSVANPIEKEKFIEVLSLAPIQPLFSQEVLYNPFAISNVKIGINGFGRIGQLLFRCVF